MKLLLKLLEKMKERIENTNISSESHKWVVFSAYVVVCSVVSLRGVESFILDLNGLIQYWNGEK